MTLLDEMQKEPWRFDFFSVMRRLERIIYRPAADRRQRGSSRRIRDTGPGPIHGFSGLESEPRGPDGQRLKIFVKFLGLLGPQGRAAADHNRGKSRVASDAGRGFPALPGPVQSSFHSIVLPGLVGRAADRPARPPEGRRFIAYIGSLIGVGSTPLRYSRFGAGCRLSSRLLD